MILRVFDKIAKNTKHLIEIFVNYDCDVESKDILEKMIDTLSKIAQGKFSRTEHSNMLTEKEEHSLKLYALKILASVVNRLNQFLTEEQKDNRESNRQQNSGGFKNEADEDEEQSPHYLQQMNDTVMSIDPKKDNYEKNRQLKSNLNKAATKFNLKPKKGVEYLLEFNNAKDADYDTKLEMIVNFLRTTPSLDKTAIGDYLGEDIQLNKDVLYKLIESMDFTNKPFVAALKLLLAGFRLPGEGQKVDRIMEKFGEKYAKDNPNTFGSSECIYVLSYATMMLQTSIHNPSARNLAMSLDDYMKMTKGINNGQDLDPAFLEEIYRTIEVDPISLVEDDEARIRQEGSSASSYKRKQEIFIKEGQGLAKRGHELMKEKKKTTQFILVNDSEAIGPLFESCWSAMFAVFSVLLEEHDDPKIIALCIDGFLNSIKICGFYCMNTERDAFVGSLANFTGIYKVTDNDNLLKRELTDKNIKCTQAILHLAMYEGAYLADSWINILKVMSMINYYHTIGSGSRDYSELFLESERSSSRTDPETEAVKLQNAAHILSAIDENEIEKIFSNSASLGPIAIVDLIRCMCIVSNEELNKKEGPRIFLLQKLVEVADLNMHRPRIEFSHMWKEMKDHISAVGSHPNERVAEYAIDSLRQLAKKFLEKEELNNYHFQKDFLEPFNIIMLSNMPVRMNIIHFIMSCMCLFARQKTSNLRSGWEIIIEILKFGGENHSYDLSKEAIDTLSIILNEKNFQYVEEYFDKIVNCLVRFARNNFEDHALIALDLIEKVAGYLGDNKGLIDRIIEKRSIKISSKRDKELFKKDLWKSIFYDLSNKSFDEKNKVTDKCHQVLFDLMARYNSKLSSTLWEMIFKELLKAIFDDLQIKIENKSIDSNKKMVYIKNAKLVIADIISLIHSMEQDKFVLSVNTFLAIVKNFSLTYQNSQISIEMLTGLRDLTQHCGDRFDQPLWKSFIGVICELFDNREDKSLLEDDQGISEEESKYGSSSKLTDLYSTQASRLLQLINNTDDIAKMFHELENEDISKLLKNLEYAYDVVHKFNMNIPRRLELFEKIDLRASNDKVPILLKHEIKSLEVYFIFLDGLYNEPKSNMTKEEITAKIINFSVKVLKDFANNYDQMLHLAGKYANSPNKNEKYGAVDLVEVIEEMKRILVSISLVVSKSVLRTLLHMQKADLKDHAKTLTPLLIDCTVCDQLEFNLRLKEVLKKLFKMLIDETD